MKKIVLSILLMLCSGLSFAKAESYSIIFGGGVDDISLGLKDTRGKKIFAYCVNKCGDWFEASDEHDGVQLKQKYMGKTVTAELSFEKNKDRIVGPSEDEKFYFIKKIKMIN